MKHSSRIGARLTGYFLGESSYMDMRRRKRVFNVGRVPVLDNPQRRWSAWSQHPPFAVF